MALPSDPTGAVAHFPRQVGIDAYGNGGFRFAEMSHRGSLLCLPTGMWNWAATTAGEVTLASLMPVLEAAESIDVLLIGLGADISAIDPTIREAFRARKVIIEAVNTGSAVRTYNVLLAEERAIAAAFIAVEKAR
ncbi:MAG: hypothetical protein KIS86_16000 [Devosia sp.]|nr:hypothetical protein [Devosia sp.]